MNKVGHDTLYNIYCSRIFEASRRKNSLFLQMHWTGEEEKTGIAALVEVVVHKRRKLECTFD